MVLSILYRFTVYVALLAEGVDRNLALRLVCLRRLGVALLAEGVDRNEPLLVSMVMPDSRPPRGGRG